MKKRIISILLALSMTVSAGVSALAAPSDIPFEQRTMAVDTIKADKAIEAFESDLKKSNNYDKVFEDYKSLMDLSVEISDIMNLNWAETEKLNYGMNTTSTRDELDKNYNECSEYKEKIDEQIKSILESKYADDFKKYWGDDKTEKVQNMSGIADMAAKEFNDRYYELLNKNADGKEFASLLKEVIAHNKNDEELDEETAERLHKIINYCNSIADYGYYVNKFNNYGAHLGLTEIKGENNIDNPIKKLAFVGDGINDAPVLTRADIGIAMGSMGSDAAIEAADVVLMDDDVRKIASLVKIARKTLSIVHQNIVFALGVKAIVLILGAFGIANMWEAVFADVGVSVIAILNSMRTLRIAKK